MKCCICGNNPFKEIQISEKVLADVKAKTGKTLPRLFLCQDHETPFAVKFAGPEAREE